MGMVWDQRSQDRQFWAQKIHVHVHMSSYFTHIFCLKKKEKMHKELEKIDRQDFCPYEL